MEKENRQFKMISLFDGSGSFPFAASLCGIEPVAASEVEPFPIKVTRARFPNMKHYGDISKMNGAELEPVDVITFGSPCQDLSIAGKRAGLEGERSGLYKQAVRIFKEMLDATNGEYPKILIFENVPGMLTSNKGEDFKVALDMIQDLGFIPDANFLDAQFMGVPQRRKRVCITWVNVNFILKKRTIISDSITLQFLTEILQINLGGLLKALGADQKKSAVLGLRNYEDGLNRRMKLFSLQKESRLQMLQERLDEMQAMYLKEQKNSDSIHGDGQMDLFMWTQEDTKFSDLKTENQSTSIGQSLKTALEEGLQIQNECITSTWTKEIIDQKICFYLKASLNTLNVTTHLMQSLEKKQPTALNYYEWVLYILTEMEEFINAGKKNEKSFGRMGWNDVLRNIECDISTYKEKVERYFRGKCTRKILPKREGLSRNFTESRHSWQSLAGCFAESIGEAGQCDIGIPLDMTHANDVIREYKDGICPTLQHRMGTGGNQVPITMQVRCGKEGGGKGALLQNDLSVTPMYSLMSETQHGICVIEGNGSRPSHRGDGYKESNIMYTLNSTEQHALAYSLDRASFNQGKNAKYDISIQEDISQTLVARGPNAVMHEHKKSYRMEAFGQYSESDKASCMKSRDHKDATDLIVETEYIVRRLTPLECSRLQGLPDWWCDGIEVPEPTEEDLKFWREVFETHREIVTHAKKPKTDKQIIKWLKEPDTDGAKYKMYGNGIALPCFLYVMEGIKEVLERTSNKLPQKNDTETVPPQ